MNSNLFFHFVIPVLSIFTFIFFEKSNVLFFKQTVLGVLPTIFYSIYYISNILLHMEKGKISPTYDWYHFVQNGVWTGLIVGPFLFLLSYGISYFLWRFNRIK